MNRYLPSLIVFAVALAVVLGIVQFKGSSAYNTVGDSVAGVGQHIKQFFMVMI